MRAAYRNSRAVPRILQWGHARLAKVLRARMPLARSPARSSHRASLLPATGQRGGGRAGLGARDVWVFHRFRHGRGEVSNGPGSQQLPHGTAAGRRSAGQGGDLVRTRALTVGLSRVHPPYWRRLLTSACKRLHSHLLLSQWSLQEPAATQDFCSPKNCVRLCALSTAQVRYMRLIGDSSPNFSLMRCTLNSTLETSVCLNVSGQ